MDEIKFIEENKQFLNSLGINCQKGIWIFGYGSLVWRVNFKYDEQRVGYIKGYVRRFWQTSTDHRGSEKLPGRVATLVSSEKINDIVYGVAYHIPPVHVQEAINTLNIREKQGYTMSTIDFFPRNGNKMSVLLYIAKIDNNNFEEEHNLDILADCIAKAVGLSGENQEYLICLAEALKNNNMVTSDDEKHTMEIYRKVKQILKQTVTVR